MHPSLKLVLIVPFCAFFIGTACIGKLDKPDSPQIKQSQTVTTHSASDSMIYRTGLFQRLKNKVERKEPLVAHILVPLCDNDNQGIYPVNAKLGNGLNLNTNLYWGARYGMKSYFRLSKSWTLLSSEKNVSDDILERVTFKKNGANVYLVADAYRGDRMKACLKDYFNALAGKLKKSYQTKDSLQLGIHSNADLIVFNGHNGLMDEDIDVVYSSDDVIRETAVIGCFSYSYFAEYLADTKTYPLVTTTHLMAPEAYVVEAIVNTWSQLKSGAEVKKAAGSAYNKYQKCGETGAQRLFKTGW